VYLHIIIIIIVIIRDCTARLLHQIFHDPIMLWLHYNDDGTNNNDSNNDDYGLHHIYIGARAISPRQVFNLFTTRKSDFFDSTTVYINNTQVRIQKSEIGRGRLNFNRIPDPQTIIPVYVTISKL